MSMVSPRFTPRRPLFWSCLSLLPALVAVLAARPAAANERHFTYTYESAVLPQGGRELEVWTTPRLGRESYYARFDQRVEFEVGLTGRLQTAFYLNFNAITETRLAAAGLPDSRESTVEFAGVSSEWKYKLTDPVANAVGFALYGEVTASTSELELETKLIFDKRVGPVLLAANVIPELELEFTPGETVKEWVFELDLGATYFLTPGFSLGLEVRSRSEAEEELERSVLYAGPVIAYATPSWWIGFTLFAQLPALKKPSGQTGALVLDDFERFNARLLFSFHL
jgi:hypothetical protein